MTQEMEKIPIMEMETIIPSAGVSWHMAAHFSNTPSILEGEQECYSCNGSGNGCDLY